MSAKLGVDQRKYKEFAKMAQPSKPWAKNGLRAFVTGGAICVVGQGLQDIFIHYFHFTVKTAGNPTVAVLIMISALLTGLGVYDGFAQWAGAGSAVPVTGFANAVASAALEHKSEGLVAGIGSNMFKVAGPVIVFGVVSAFVVGLLRFMFLKM